MRVCVRVYVCVCACVRVCVCVCVQWHRAQRLSTHLRDFEGVSGVAEGASSLFECLLQRTVLPLPRPVLVPHLTSHRLDLNT